MSTGACGASGRRRRRAARPRRGPGRRSPRTSGIVPIRLDAAVTATSRVRSLSTASTCSGVELAGLGVEVGPAHGRPDRLGGDHPGPHVGVVVEPGHDDLVARAPALGEGAGEVHRQLGHRAPEHDPGAGRRRAGRPSRRAARDDRGLGVALGRRHVAAVGQRRGQHVVHRPRDDVGRLRAARPVEVGGTRAGAVLELREVGRAPARRRSSTPWEP